jgi:hypothetical protein
MYASMFIKMHIFVYIFTYIYIYIYIFVFSYGFLFGLRFTTKDMENAYSHRKTAIDVRLSNKKEPVDTDINTDNDAKIKVKNFQWKSKKKEY